MAPSFRGGGGGPGRERQEEQELQGGHRFERQRQLVLEWDQPPLPKLNLAEPGAREHVLSAAEHWLRFGIDGWR
ncbi:MAG: hypothetical protein ACXWLR_00210, partial [Myxococcales bacterium]